MPLAPVVQDPLEEVRVAALGYGLEEVAADDFARHRLRA